MKTSDKRQSSAQMMSPQNQPDPDEQREVFARQVTSLARGILGRIFDINDPAFSVAIKGSKRHAREQLCGKHNCSNRAEMKRKEETCAVAANEVRQAARAHFIARVFVARDGKVSTNTLTMKIQ